MALRTVHLAVALGGAAPGGFGGRDLHGRRTRSATAIDWQPCPDTDGSVECATIEVPLDWSRPRGQKIEISLARRPATNPDARIGSILLDSGGPGTSGVVAVKHNPQFTSAESDRFDVIGFDARGANTGTRVTCDADLLDQVRAAMIPSSQADFNALREANRKLSQNCRERTGPVYDHLDSRHLVRDIEAIRVALGEDGPTPSTSGRIAQHPRRQ